MLQEIVKPILETMLRETVTVTDWQRLKSVSRKNCFAFFFTLDLSQKAEKVWKTKIHTQWLNIQVWNIIYIFPQFLYISLSSKYTYMLSISLFAIEHKKLLFGLLIHCFDQELLITKQNKQKKHACKKFLQNMNGSGGNWTHINANYATL